ncbi:MAG: histidine phosphatase family protein [Lachnospiraceae bacterium]|nr:histidine phosphatase family protein [Lachnospiraceae bacterium]
MRLIMVRHGDPDYEKDCLTELGHRQAELVAERLMDEGIQEIYSSPLGRARETAEHFAARSGIGPIKTLDFMREIRYGWEGELYKKGNPWIEAAELISKGKDLQTSDWRKYPSYDGNTATIDIDKVAAGTDEWLKTLGYEREGLYYRCKTEDDRKRTFVLFCHGGSMTSFLSRVFNIPFPHLCMVLGFIQCTSITVLRFNREPGSLAMPLLEVAAEARHLNVNTSEIEQKAPIN